MNIEPEKLWKNMGSADECQTPIDFSINVNNSTNETSSPLFKIKKSLEIGMIWIGIFLALYITAILVFQPVFTKISLLILAGYSIYCFIQSINFHRQITTDVLATNSLKTELERHYYSIMRWCKLQERNAIFLYPVSILGGAILGLSTAGVEKMNHLLHKPALWAILTGFIIILSPVLFYMTRWMMKVAYYKHLEHLKNLIDLFVE